MSKTRRRHPGFVLAAGICLALACGGSSPTAPDSTPVSTVWTINSDPASLHAARFVPDDLSGTQLDFWQRSDDTGISELRILFSNGGRLLLQLNTDGQPTYLEDPIETMLWVNDYLADGSVDVTVANPRFSGDVWRGRVTLSATTPAPASLTDVSGLSQPQATTPAELSELTGTFCGPTVPDTITLLNDRLCEVSDAVDILSSPPLGGSIVRCEPQAQVVFTLDAQVCSFLRIAAEAAADPNRIATNLLDEPQSPIPAAPEATVFP